MKINMEVSNEVRVKDEPICYSQSISDDEPNKPKRQSILGNKVKKEPIEIEMQKSNSHMDSRSEEVEVKEEEKFSSRKEFMNKISIAFLNEETTTSSNDDNLITNTNQPTTSNNEPNNSRNKKSK